MNEKKYKAGGIIGTVLFHLILVACFLFFGFSSPLPPPAEQGIEVNLGYSNDGIGDIQPDDPNSEDANNSEASANSEDDYSTQNSEETASLDKKTDNKTNTSEKKTNPTNPNALYSGKKNTDGGSEGETGKPGDQGDPNGDPNAKNHYGTPGPGGISFNLGGRTYKSLPKPSYNSREEGKVVVTIWVDPNGKVTRASVSPYGTTTTDPVLQKNALDAALKSTFNEKSNAPFEQKGTITYNFINLN
jgi:TonB family protein